MEGPKMEKIEALPTPTEYMLTCCLCNSLVQYSVLLNCLHTCCSQCFSMAASKSAVGDVACGACSSITQAGTEQPNRFVDSQVLLYSTSAESNKCQACRDREHLKDAAVWCPACQLSFCADCAEWHRLFKEDHCTESLSESPQTLFSTCPIHKETLDACVDCQQTKCLHCCRECSERKHTILAIGDDSFNGYVRDLIASISSTEEELNEKLKVHERPHIILSILNSVRADHLQQIRNKRRRARETVKGVYDRIEYSTTQAYRELEMEAELAAAKTDRIESSFANARSYFQRLVHSKRMHDIFDQHKIILKHLKVLSSELDQVKDTMCKNRTTNVEPSLPEDLENIVRAWIGKPLLHTVADDFSVRKAQPKSSPVSTAPATTQHLQQIHPDDFLKCASPASDYPPLAERLSAVDSTRHMEGASSTATTSIQAELSSCSAVAAAPAATAAGYTSAVISKEPSSNESSSSEQATPAATYEDLRIRLDAWKHVNVNIGVIGACGSGKSTLINTLRRLKPEQPGAAKTNVVQTTIKPTPYSYPKHPSLKLWNLPEVGTPDFPIENYLSLIQIEKYDFFLIVCSTRFTENDIWVARELQRLGKQFHFVRTKVDIDIQNDREDYPSTHDEKKLLDKLREDCAQSLTADKFGDLFVALVCKDPDAFDFPKLEQKIISGLKDLRQDAMLFTLSTLSVKFIKKKTARLLKRVELVGFAAGAVALLPGISTLVSTRLIYSELKFYKEVYHLTDEQLKDIMHKFELSKDDIDYAVGDNFWVDLTFRNVLNEMSNFVRDSREHSRTLWKDVVSVFRFAHSFRATPQFLRNSIASMESAALNILNMLFEGSCLLRIRN